MPRPGAPNDAANEDNGWVLAVVWDATVNRSSLVILDSRKLADGPLATIRLPHHIPLGLHGGWTSAVLGMADTDEKPYDIRNGV